MFYNFASGCNKLLKFELNNNKDFFAAKDFAD